MSAPPFPFIRLFNCTYYPLAALLICAACFHSNHSYANDNKDVSSEAMKHENMNHGEIKHDKPKHGKNQYENMKHNDMKHNDMAHHNMDTVEHSHTPVDVSTWPSVPSLTLTAFKDTMAGWNLHIEPTYFEFTPEQVNTANRVGKGHAHLYINGKKITRLYSSWYYLNNLQPGIHSVTVSLNANDHGPLVLHDQYISATIELVQE